MSEAIPPNSPGPRRKGMSLNLFVYASHAGKLATIIFHTGLIIFIAI